MYKIVEGERLRLEELRTDLPAPLVEIVNQMMARSPEDRYPNWAAVLSALSASVPKTPVTEAGRPAQSEMFESMRALALFKAFNDAELWQLIRIARWYALPATTVLVREGADARSCYLLLAGDARVTQQGKIINLLGSGTLFGELAFAEELPGKRAATVTAATDVTIGKWPYESLRKAPQSLQAKMLQVFFRIAAERIKQIDQLYHALYQKHVLGNAD